MLAPFIPRIPGDAFGREPRGYDDLRRLAARYARDALAGRTLANHATQLAITLTPEALAAATRPGAPAALLWAITELPLLLAHALYVRTVADRQRRPEVRRLQLLGATAEVAGRPVELLFVVRENFNGQCFLDRVIERGLPSPKRSPGFARAGVSGRGRQEGGGAPADPMATMADASDNAAASPRPMSNSDLAGPERHFPTAQPYPTQEQLQNIIFQETQSYSGPWSYDARVNIAHTILNRHDAGIVGGVGRPYGGVLSPGAAAAIARSDSASVAAYEEAGRAAADALSHPNDDPTGGALFFRQGTATANPAGLAHYGIIGPLNNSYPTPQIPRNAYIRFYGKPGTQPDF